MNTEHVLTENAVVQPYIKKLTQRTRGLFSVLCGGLVITIFSSLKKILNQCHEGLLNISSVQDLQIIMFGIQIHLEQGHLKNQYFQPLTHSFFLF